MHRTLVLLVLAALAVAGCTTPEEATAPDGTAENASTTPTTQEPATTPAPEPQAATPEPTPLSANASEEAPMELEANATNDNASSDNATAVHTISDARAVAEACPGDGPCLAILEASARRGECLQDHVCADDGETYLLVETRVGNGGTSALEVMPWFFRLENEQGEHRPDGQVFLPQGGMSDAPLAENHTRAGLLAFTVDADAAAGELCYHGFSVELDRVEACRPVEEAGAQAQAPAPAS